MSIIPENETLIVDDGAVHRNGNGAAHAAETPAEAKRLAAMAAAEEDLENWGGVRSSEPPPPEAEPEASGVSAETGVAPSEWEELGDWIAERVMQGCFLWSESKTTGKGWWRWDGRCWELIDAARLEIADLLYGARMDLASEASALGFGAATVDLLRKSRPFSEQVKSEKCPLWTGLRRTLQRTMELPPDHMVNTPGGVLNLKNGELEPHTPESPYLSTSCTDGWYRPDELDEMRRAFEARVSPSIPDEARRCRMLKCLTIALGGKAGGKARGSLVYFYGEEGGGKGNSIRYIEDSCGGYCVSPNIAALLQGGDINAAMADVLEAYPRILTMSEVTRVLMEKALSVTGRDSLTARGPHKTSITRRLSCALMVSAAAVPASRSDTGMKRRFAGIRFDKAAAVTMATARDETTQDEKDALVTLALLDAILMWQKPLEWVPLPEDDEDSRGARIEADPVEALIAELDPSSDKGKPLFELVEELKAHGVRDANERGIATRLQKTGVWTTARVTIKGFKATRLFPVEP